MLPASPQPASASEETLRQLFERCPVPMWIVERDGLALLDANAAAQASYGWSREEFRRMRAPDLRAPEEAPLLRASLQGPRRESCLGRWRQRRKDGSLLSAEVYVAELVWGGRDALLLAAQETGGRARGGGQLARFIELCPLAVSVTALEDGRFLEVNNRFLELLGCRREELLGRRGVEPPTWCEPERREWIRRQLEQEGVLRDLELRLRTRGGETREVLMSAAVVDYDDRPAALAFLQDITERQQALAALRESEERFRQMADNMREVFYVAQADRGGFQYVSPAFERVWGRTCLELYRQPSLWIESVHPEDRERVLRAARQVAALGGEHGSEYRVVRPDGAVRWVWDRCVALQDGGGRPFRVVGIAEDITAMRAAQEALIASEERFRSMVENSSDAISLLSREGRVLYSSPSITRVLGWRVEEFLGRDAFADLHPEDRGAALLQFEECLGAPGRPLAGEFRYRHRDGGWRLLEAVATNRLAEPAIGAVVVNYRDITESRRAERELRHSQRLLAEAQAISHIGSWERDLLTGTVTWSDEVFRIFGIRPAEFDPRFEGFLRWIHPDDRARVREVIERSLRDLLPFAYECRIVRPDGEVRVLAVGGEVVADERGTPVRTVGICQDISHRKRAEEERQRLLESEQAARAEAQSLSRRLVELQELERRVIASELHDEIGQILTGLKLLVEADRSGGGRREELARLVNELLGKVRDLSMNLRPPMLDDLGLLPALEWHAGRYTAQTGIAVELEHAGLEARFPQAVELAAFRIVQESLTNVARHAGVRRAEVRVEADQRRLRVRVADHGAGFELRAARERAASGLSGMKERARALGGRLKISSAPGRGTVLTAELPLRQGSPRRRLSR